MHWTQVGWGGGDDELSLKCSFPIQQGVKHNLSEAGAQRWKTHQKVGEQVLLMA